jgi:hypothetical protein
MVHLGAVFTPRSGRRLATQTFRNISLGDVAAALVMATLATGACAIMLFMAKPELKTMKLYDYKYECIDLFGISGRDYQFLVWPVARKLTGLTMSAKPGPKKQIKNNCDAYS